MAAQAKRDRPETIPGGGTGPGPAGEVLEIRKRRATGPKKPQVRLSYRFGVAWNPRDADQLAFIDAHKHAAGDEKDAEFFRRMFNFWAANHPLPSPGGPGGKAGKKGSTPSPGFSGEKGAKP